MEKKITKIELAVIVCEANAKKIVSEVEAEKKIKYFDRQEKIENIAKNLFKTTYAIKMELLHCHYKRLQAAGYIA